MSPTMAEPTDRAAQARLGAPEVRRFLRDFVKRRVGDSDVDDVVQTVLVEALASTKVPAGDTDLRKWLVGVARHKIADLHRRNGREQPAELPDVETAPAPMEERELVRWVEDQTKGTKDADKTLDWMAREGEGDKLEHIAEEEKLPAATVRQRVSRMRRWMKERWLAELAAVAALGLLAFVFWRFVLNRRPDQIAVPEPIPTAPPSVTPDKTAPPIAPTPPDARIARGKDLRKSALEGECARGEGKPCLERLDEAKELDPAGDTAPEVEEARKKNEAVLREQQDLEQKQKTAPPTTAFPKAPPPPKAEPKPTSTAPTVFPKPKPSFDKKSSSTDFGSSSDGFDGTGTPAPTPQQATGSQSSDFPQALTKGGKK